MSEEISFVEVLISFYEPGHKVYQDWFESEIDCTDVNWEEATEEIKEVIEARKENEEFQNKALV